MKTIEEVKEYIIKRRLYFRHADLTKEAEDSYDIENRVGKFQFATEILNFMNSYEKSLDEMIAEAEKIINTL